MCYADHNKCFILFCAGYRNCSIDSTTKSSIGWHHETASFLSGGFIYKIYCCGKLLQGTGNRWFIGDLRWKKRGEKDGRFQVSIKSVRLDTDHPCTTLISIALSLSCSKSILTANKLTDLGCHFASFHSIM